MCHQISDQRIKVKGAFKDILYLNYLETGGSHPSGRKQCLDLWYTVEERAAIIWTTLAFGDHLKSFCQSQRTGEFLCAHIGLR